MARRTNEILDRWGPARLAFVNAGVLVALLPVAGAVRISATVIVLDCFVAFVALAVHAIATARRRG
jgi:hypothetical protein